MPLLGAFEEKFTPQSNSIASTMVRPSLRCRSHLFPIDNPVASVEFAICFVEFVHHIEVGNTAAESVRLDV
jgi:hypothetical protein